MNPLLHSLHIGTLATWLSVVGFGTVGIVIPDPVTGPTADPPVQETRWVSQDFSLGGETSAPSETTSPESTGTAPEVAPLPLPPELPEITEFPPLPEIPELPTPPSSSGASEKPTISPKPTQRKSTTRSRPKSRTGSRSGRGSSGNTGSTGKPGMSASARLAAGSMPAPSYPSTARRRGQTGTVLVEFTIDSSGRVISAVAKSPSPWPLLNREALRTVRRWRFPPGSVMTLRRPIVFQLR